MGPHKILDRNVYNSLIHNCQNQKAARMLFNGEQTGTSVQVNITMQKKSYQAMKGRG